MPLNWVLKKTLESPLDGKEIKPVHDKYDIYYIGGIWSHHFMANRWGNSG